MDLSRNNDNNYQRKHMAQMAHEEIIGRGLVQLITGPTHRQNGSESTIDLMFTNEPSKVSQSGRISTGSSHDSVWMIRKSVAVERKQEIVKRIF